MNNLEIISAARKSVSRSDLHDRIRFDGLHGAWLSLCYPNPRQPLYRVFLHDGLPGLPMCKKFGAFHEALDFIASILPSPSNISEDMA